MRAAIGDEIVVETDSVNRLRRRGEVLEVLITAAVEHYRVRWDDGHESLLFPGPDARIVRLGGDEEARLGATGTPRDATGP